MSVQRYMGPDDDLTPYTRSRLDTLNIPVVGQSEIDRAIDEGLSGKANLTYLDSSQGGLATKDAPDSYGGDLIPTSSVGFPGSPAKLVGGKIPEGNLEVPGGSRPWVYIGRISVGSGTIRPANLIDLPTSVGSINLPNLGYSYYPLFAGNVLGQLFDFQVRRGGTNGPFVARAFDGNIGNGGKALCPCGNIISTTGGTYSLVVGKKFADADSYIFPASGTIAVFAVPA